MSRIRGNTIQSHTNPFRHHTTDSTKYETKIRDSCVIHPPTGNSLVLDRASQIAPCACEEHKELGFRTSGPRSDRVRRHVL